MCIRDSNGASVTTTIDSGMCWQAQQLIDKQRADMSLEWGFTVVMEVKTGKILCLADTCLLYTSRCV